MKYKPNYNFMPQTLYSKLDIPAHDRVTSLSEEEGKFIFNFLIEKGIKRTLEIGMAYGCSTAYIISATKSLHYAIDPFQEIYQNLGTKNIASLGFKCMLNLKRELSHFALPELAREGLKIDFAFIDGDHKFDTIFCDFYYIDLMLSVGGYVMFHDTWMRSTQFVLAWIRSNKTNYKIIKIRQLNIIVVQKLADVERPWYHFKGFFTIKSIYTHWYLTKGRPYGNVKKIPALFKLFSI
jgi:predicted O-methyltransferase YrrM